VQGDRPVSPALADTLTRVRAEVAMLTAADGGLALDDDALLSATGWSTRARLALARGDLEGALSAASRVPTSPEPGDLDDVVAAIEAAICEACVAGRQRGVVQAGRAMGEALRTAAPQRILRPFLDADPGELAQILRAVTVSGAAAALRDAVLTRLGAASEAPSLPEPEPLLEPLTERELAVLAELPTMRTNEEIARDFYVSVNTIKSHLSHLYRKLGVGTRRDAVRRARELGLLE
jgi:LuxR family maltose regulon positive regulatory protein